MDPMSLQCSEMSILLLQHWEDLYGAEQVDVVLPLKTRHHAALTELITHAYILHTVYYSNVVNFIL